jgi:hypothetical protein
MRRFDEARKAFEEAVQIFRDTEDLDSEEAALGGLQKATKAPERRLNLHHATQFEVMPITS